MSVSCSHLDQIEVWDVPGRADVPGCEECLKLGMSWVHLRICRTCGHIGCCDSSEGKHATKHAHGTEHAIMTSIEPGEDWSWCVFDEVAFVVSAA